MRVCVFWHSNDAAESANHVKLKRVKDGESGRKSGLKRWTRVRECQGWILRKNLEKRENREER